MGSMADVQVRWTDTNSSDPWAWRQKHLQQQCCFSWKKLFYCSTSSSVPLTTSPINMSSVHCSVQSRRETRHRSACRDQSLCWVLPVATIQTSVGMASGQGVMQLSSLHVSGAACSVRRFLVMVFSRKQSTSDQPPIHYYTALCLALYYWSTG